MADRIVPENIQHIFFDLDHTIWDFNTNSRQTIGQLLNEFETEIGETISLDAFMDHYLQINSNLWDRYRRNLIHQNDIRRIRFPETFRKVGVAYAPWMDSFGKAYIEICPKKNALIPGARETLEVLAEKFSLHIITNGFNETQTIKLSETGLEKLFDVVVTSEMASSRKPEPGIFRFALESAKALPSESVFIGDDYDVDVVGGMQAGMNVVFFNPDRKNNPLQVTEVHRFKELTKVMGM